jgi:adenylosuccinate lyase
LVEIEYFIALCEVPLPQLKGVNPDLFDTKISIKTSLLKMRFGSKKQKVTNHDVKVLYQRPFEKLGLSQYKEFIHFDFSRH